MKEVYQRTPKTHKWYMFYRPFVGLVFFAWLIFLFVWIVSVTSNKGPSVPVIITFGVLAICLAIAVFMIMSVFVFGFEYSYLGEFERSSFPDEQPIFSVMGTWGQIGSLHATVPFFSWYVYPSGLGISIMVLGKVFIPIDSIKSIKDNGGSLSLRARYELTHSSPEVASPIYLPDKGVFESLSNFVNQRSKNNPLK